jgi:hypothetical protein
MTKNQDVDLRDLAHGQSPIYARSLTGRRGAGPVPALRHQTVQNMVARGGCAQAGARNDASKARK